MLIQEQNLSCLQELSYFARPLIFISAHFTSDGLICNFTLSMRLKIYYIESDSIFYFRILFFGKSIESQWVKKKWKKKKRWEAYVYRNMIIMSGINSIRNILFVYHIEKSTYHHKSFPKLLRKPTLIHVKQKPKQVLSLIIQLKLCIFYPVTWGETSFPCRRKKITKKKKREKKKREELWALRFCVEYTHLIVYRPGINPSHLLELPCYTKKPSVFLWQWCFTLAIGQQDRSPRAMQQVDWLMASV